MNTWKMGWAHALAVSAVFLASGWAIAQEVATTPPPTPPEATAPTLTAPSEQPPIISQPFPAIPGMPSPPGYPAAPTGDPGTRNAYQYTQSEDGAALTQQHAVTTPHGEMIQSREWSQTDGTYSFDRQQTWTNPDGTPLRQHEMSVTGTDPYNYERQHTVTLRDGRTISHTQTRTWDGTTGTMEHSFSGPNGQTRTREHSWTPDGVSETGGMAGPGTVETQPTLDPPQPTLDPTQPTLDPPQLTLSEAPLTGTGSVSTPSPKSGWWSRWNPFTKFGKPSSGHTARRGFTMGSSAGGQMASSPKGLAREQAGIPSTPHRFGQQQHVGKGLSDVAQPNPGGGHGRGPTMR